MMKKTYETAQIVCVILEKSDVLTLSNATTSGGDPDSVRVEKLW